MSADFSPQNSPVVESLDALVSWFSEGEKRDSPLKIGTEVEKLTFLKDSLRPLPYTTGIKPLLQALVKHGWEPLPNAEQPTMLKRGSASITLEPGGQMPFIFDAEQARGRISHGERSWGAGGPGSSKRMVVPVPGPADATWSWPPRFRTSAEATYSPRPVPRRAATFSSGTR